jgi:hypothetical protein
MASTTRADAAGGPLLTPGQVAQVMACSPDLVHDLISSRALPAVLISQNVRSRKPRFRVRPEDLHKFIESRMVRPPARRLPRRGNYERLV